MSMLLVPADTPGVQIVRSVGVGVGEIDLHDPERGTPPAPPSRAGPRTHGVSATAAAAWAL